MGGRMASTREWLHLQADRCTHYPRPMASPSAPDDLFAAAAEDRLTRQAPLAARMRPATLDDVVGQDQLLGAGRPLRSTPP